jgi:phospholipid-binding lipoprotein MlaA
MPGWVCRPLPNAHILVGAVAFGIEPATTRYPRRCLEKDGRHMPRMAGGRGISLVLSMACAALAGCASERPPAPLVEEASSPTGTAVAGSQPEAPDPGNGKADPLFDEPGSYEPPASPPDPLEPANRAFFAFNRTVDRWFWTPLTDAYRFVTPEPARRGVRRALHNLNSPVFFVNDLLQLRFRDAGETLGSFALNSTLGILGFFEPSKEAGWQAREADFGQTLELTGVGSGPYVVVPILGPTTLRDGFGAAVDRFFQPLTYMLGLGTQLLWGGGAGLSTREEASDQLKALEKSSVDFYSVMRSAYLQNREEEVAEARRRRHADLVLILPDAWLSDRPEAAPHRD